MEICEFFEDSVDRTIPKGAVQKILPPRADVDGLGKD